jgi:hypothetical protein
MTSTLFDQLSTLYNDGLLPVLGHATIDPNTGKKTDIRFTKGWNDMSTNLDYFITASEALDQIPNYYNIIALHFNPKISPIKAIDLDIIKDNYEDSFSDINELIELAKANGNPIDQTPSGGYHIFYKSDTPLFDHISQRCNKLPTMGIDLLERSMLCIVDGPGYKKVNYTRLDPNTIPSLSKEFIHAITDECGISLTKPTIANATATPITSSSSDTSFYTTATTPSLITVEELVKGIDITNEPKIKGLGSYNNYPAYIKVLTAIYNATVYDRDGGLKIAQDFSHRIATHYKEDADKYVNETTRKWKSGWKEDKDNRITIKTLYKLSNYRCGTSDGGISLLSCISTDEYYAFIGDRDIDEWMIEEQYDKKWNNKLITEPITLYQFLYDTQRAYKRTKFPHRDISVDEDGEMHFATPSDFTVRIKLTDKIRRYGFMSNGKMDSLYMVFGDYLKKYTKMGFYPNKPPNSNVINTWKGFKATMIPNSHYDQSIIEPFLYHITNVICNSNADHAAWLIDWFADVMQNPTNKPGTATIFYSKTNGTGKSIVFEFFINMILGRDIACICNGLRSIISDHNTICKDKLFINVEEAFTSKANYLECSSLMKGLITASEMVINPKGVDAYTVDSYLRIGTTTNHIASIPLDDTDRRFSIFEVSDRHCGDKDYFDALGKHFTDQNFANHVFTYLSNRTITSNLNQAIKTDIKARSIDICADPLTQFTSYIIDNDYVYHHENNVLDFKKHHVVSNTFIDAYHYFCKTYLSTKAKGIYKYRKGEGLPNNLMIKKYNKYSKEYFYFSDITPPNTYQD